MKKIMIHFFKTLWLLALVVILYMLPIQHLSGIVLPILIGSFLFCGGVFLYAKKYFILILIAFFPFLIQAQTATIWDTTFKSAAESNLRSAVRSEAKHISRRLYSVDETSLDSAHKVLYLVDKYRTSSLDKNDAPASSYANPAKSLSSSADRAINYLKGTTVRGGGAMGQQLRRDIACGTVETARQTWEKNCWVCNLAIFLLQAFQNLMRVSDNVLGTFALDLLGVGFAIWLVLHVLEFMGSFSFNGMTYIDKDGRRAHFIERVFSKLFLVIICAVCIKLGTANIYAITVYPITGVMGGTMQDITAAATNNTSGSVCRSFCDPNAISTYKTSAIFGNKVAASLLCSTCSIYSASTPYMAEGQVLLCRAVKEQKNDREKKKLPASFFGGIALILVYGFISLVVGFYLVDIFFLLSFFAVLAPLWVALFPFKITRSYAKRAFDVIIYGMTQMLLFAMALLLITNLTSPLIFSEHIGKLNSEYGPLENYYGIALAVLGLISTVVFIFLAMHSISALTQGLTGIYLGFASPVEDLFASLFVKINGMAKNIMSKLK